MPLYIYGCAQCLSETEELYSASERPDAVLCPKCGAVADRQLAPGQFQVNGANAANRYSGDSNIRWFGVGSSDDT